MSIKGPGKLLPLSARYDNKVWHLFEATYTTDDPCRSVFHFYALSEDHARMVLHELRQTAVFAGRVTRGIQVG